MFPAGSYQGSQVTKVSLYDYGAFTGTATIYNDGATSPANSVGSISINCSGTNTFVEFEFPTPLSIDPSKNLWVVLYNSNSTQYPAGGCADMGDPNSRWVSLDGTTWEDLAGYNFNYTWMVRVYLDTGSPWDLLMTFTAPEGGQYGVAYDGNNFYTSNWGYSGAAHNFYKYDLQGNMLDGFEISGCGNLRGMTYDGNYFYGVAISSTVYCVDLANHSLVNTFTTSYGTMRGITYDPARNGFWVIGNWSGNLTLINRTGAIQFTGPALSSISDLAYYMDENNVEHVFCFNNADNGVYDYNITTNTFGGSVFDFSTTPGFDAGSAGGCTVGIFNNKKVFIGDVQQSPNLIGIYELGSQPVNNFTVTVSASPANGGTVSGGGSYAQGTLCTVHAMPNTGYDFVKWTENGSQVSTDPNYTFIVTGNRNLVARFQKQTFTITASANPTNGGTISGGGTYTYGSTCTLTAIANGSYNFVKWTKNGTQVSTNPTYSFTVTEGGAYVAHFEQNVTYYTINATANPATGGTITGAGSYAQGTTCNLHAIANSGYSFVKWTKNGTVVSTNADYSFTVTGNASFVAHFEQSNNNYVINVTADPSVGGSVSGAGTYAQGSTCNLHAIANSGYTFAKWTKNGTDVSTNANYSFIVTGNASFVAHFEQTINNYSINAYADPSEGGSVSGAGTYADGSTCTLTALPNFGWVFENWTQDGTIVSTNPSYSFTVTSNASFVAHFSQSVNNFTITAIAIPAEGGSISGSGTYALGTTCTLVATPNSNYSFANWTDANGVQVSSDSNFSFTVTGNAVYVANFRQNINNYVINVIANPIEGGVISGGGTYQEGATCVLSALPNDGWLFLNWTKNGIVLSTNQSCSFYVTGDATITANFVPINYTINVEANPVIGGTVSGGGAFVSGLSCTVTAVANDGYTFSNWTENGVMVSQDAQYTFTVERDRSLIANFSSTPYYIISASCTANGSISPQGDIQVVAGADQSFTITPDFGCLINKVLVDGVDCGSINTYTFSNVAANHTIHVLFSGWAVEESSALGVRVYPNPVRDILVVEGDGIKVIQVYDLLGNKIRDMHVNDGMEAIDFRNLTNGIYIVVVTLENGKKCQQNIVLSKRE